MNELERRLYRILCWAILVGCTVAIIPTIQGNLPVVGSLTLLLVVIYHFTVVLIRDE